VCFINGHVVSSTQDNSAIMMAQFAMKEITDSLFHGEKPFNVGGDNEQAQESSGVITRLCIWNMVQLPSSLHQTAER